MAPNRIRAIIDVVRAVARNDSASMCSVSLRSTVASTMLPATPRAADSVGVAQPA